MYTCSQCDLDHREEELAYREERMKEWAISLQGKESEIRKRYANLHVYTIISLYTQGDMNPF